MTSILRSLPACFSRSASVGSWGSVLFPCRPNFRCHFQKRWWSNWCLFCFNADIEKEKKNLNKYTNHYVSWARNESRHIAGCYISEHHFKSPWTCILTPGHWHKVYKKGLILKRKEGGTERPCLKKSVQQDPRSWPPSRPGRACSARDSDCCWVFLLLRRFLVKLSVTPALTREEKLAWLKDWARAIDDKEQDAK